MYQFYKTNLHLYLFLALVKLCYCNTCFVQSCTAGFSKYGNLVFHVVNLPHSHFPYLLWQHGSGPHQNHNWKAAAAVAKKCVELILPCRTMESNNDYFYFIYTRLIQSTASNLFHFFASTIFFIFSLTWSRKKSSEAKEQ